MVILAFGVLSQIKGFELYFLIISRFEPSHHRVVVCPTSVVLISPFVVSCFKLSHRLVSLSHGIVIVSQNEAIVVVLSDFSDAN